MSSPLLRSALPTLAPFALLAAGLAGVSAAQEAPRPGFDPQAYQDVWLHEVDDRAVVALGAMGVDIQNRQGRDVMVYVTAPELARLIGLGFQPTLLPKAGGAARVGWPTFAELSARLQAVAAANPSICQLTSLGKSVQGRDLWMLRISDNVALEEDEPEVRFISTMHGDEVVGIELCLRLIDELVAGYGSDPQIDELVNETELWIMPLMNPDGYELGSRYNAQGFDLNREFPDRITDPVNSPAGRPPEVQHLMNWGYAHSPVLSANFHGGTVVVNYPYDSSSSPFASYAACPDDGMFIAASLTYSKLNGPMYASPIFPQGITNGVAWYTAYGGMQDWNYVWQGCNDVTIELSNTKWPSYSSVPGYWSDNRDAMLAYAALALRGVRGVVTDGLTGQPLAASMKVVGIEHEVFTDPDVGDYHRLLLPGTYDLEFSAPGYGSQVLTGVVVAPGAASVRDVALLPFGGGAPQPDIRVNGQDGPLTVSSTATTTISVALDPGALVGTSGDWWVSASSGPNTFWYKLPAAWSLAPTPAFVGPLFSLPSFPILAGQLPPGQWTFGFAIDQADGTYQGTYADSVTVTSL